MMKIVVTGACAVSSRSVLRSLKKSEKFRNSEFVGWDMATTLYGIYEGLFDRIYKVPAVKDPAYRRVVSEILAREKPDAVIVVPEVEVLHWAENPFPVPSLLPPPEFCRTVISKEKLFDVLSGTGLIPKSLRLEKSSVLSGSFKNPFGYPAWIRDASAGTASGKGSFMAGNETELRAWVEINTGIENFQLSEFLPGGNYGCFCLFKDGVLKKLAIAERIEYIMAKVAVSGITGNTSKGRLLNDPRIRKVALDTIGFVANKCGVKMNGLVVADMKADAAGNPKVTEINIRHVAFSSSFANAGFNLSEYHLLCALGRESELSPEIEKTFPKNNLILRDVDGAPVFVDNYVPMKIGEARSAPPPQIL